MVAITTAIWLITCAVNTDLLYPWPVWVAGPWGAVLLVQTVGGLIGGAPQKWQTELDRAERKKLAKSERKKLAKAAENDV